MLEHLDPGAEGLGGHGLGHEHALFAVVALLFAALVGGLILWFRRASRAAEIEEIDRLLDED
ncbi:MAG TPA: hypothetical protein VNO33_16955 [Kofleriaceae bacterium]|nr:hypothetical protein [Kofleriaceae bacterium]